MSAGLAGLGTLRPAGEVVVADDFEQQVGMVRRFTGLNPRQDWQHILATRGRYLWQKFYLSPVPDALQWPRGRQIELMFRDSSHVRSGEIFVVTPDERRVPTLLARGEGALDTHDLLRHDSKSLVLYVGFPIRVQRDTMSVAWQFSDVIAIR